MQHFRAAIATTGQAESRRVHPGLQTTAPPLEPRRRRTTVLCGWALTFLAAALPAQWGEVEDDKSLFSIPRSQDDIHALKTAREDIAAGRFGFAVERLHTLLERGRPGLCEVEPGRYLGMRHAVVEVLRDLPEAAQQAYEKLAAREAGALLHGAFRGHDPEALQLLSRRFPTTAAGRRAFLRLGDLWLECGQGERAIPEYRALLDALPPRHPLRTEVSRRLAAAMTLTGRATGDSDLSAVAAPAQRSTGWPAYGGGRDGARPMHFTDNLGRSVQRLQLASPGYASQYPLVSHATGGLDGLFFNTGHQVVAYDPVGGRIAWKAAGPMVGLNEDTDYDTLSRSMLLTAAVSPDIVVAALQVPNSSRAASFHQLELIYKLPTRRLFAFDRHTGKRLWMHWDYEGGPVAKRFASHNAPAPPIIDGDTVYVPTEHYTGAVTYYLSAYDLRTGAPRWRTLICSSQLEVNMFGNARVEYAATPVAIHQGVLYGTTNLGLCYAADAATGRVRWCSAYPVIPLPRTRLQGQQSRPVFFANNPILVADGVMVSTPLDSEFVLAHDIDTGALRWKLHWRSQARHQNGIKWLLGVLGDEVILSGSGVIGVGLKSSGTPRVRQIRPPQYFGHTLSSRIPRGAVTKRYILQPMPSGLHAFDAQGNAAPRPFTVENPGNLLMIDGMLVTTRANEVQVFLDRERLLEQTRNAIRAAPDDPANYLRMATLTRGSGGEDLYGIRGTATIELLRKGLAAAKRAGMGKDAPLYQNLAGELFKISMLRATRAAKQGFTAQAIQQLERARDTAPNPDSWITAQLELLGLLERAPDKALAELDRLTTTHGSVEYRFPRLGRMPARAFALWRSSRLEKDPRAVVRRCQELLENFPRVVLDGESAREFAERCIAEQIRTHGREVYAAIEARAGEALRAAGTELTALRDVDQRFPHSEAGAQARRQVLDAAVLRGDLGTAAAMTCRGSAVPGADMLRRLMVAAEKAGNLPLAAALGQRLLRDHASAVSTLLGENGKTMRDAVQVPGLPSDAGVHPDLPARQIGAAIGDSRRSHFEVLTTRLARGFGRAAQRPLYVAEDRDRLLAFELGGDHQKPIFSIDAHLSHYWAHDDAALWLCGDRLLLNEGQRLRAIDFRKGTDLWTVVADQKRSFRILGVAHGVVHVHAAMVDDGDGGEIVGIDAVRGARLFQHTFARTRETLAPRSFLDDLWTLHNPPRSGQVEVLRFDGITGHLLRRFTVPDAVVRRLGLPSLGPGEFRLARQQRALLVDAEHVYLTSDDYRGAHEPFVTALRHDGGLHWTWTSEHRVGAMALCTLHASGVVVVETSSGSRGTQTELSVLDRSNGTRLRGVRLRGRAKVLNERPSPTAPDLLLIEERYGSSSTTLVGYSIDGAGPSFRFDTRRTPVFWSHPVVGEDFLAALLLDPHGVRMQMLVIDLRNRRGALPDQKSTRTMPDRSNPYTMTAYDRFTVCRTPKGILVFGK